MGSYSGNSVVAPDPSALNRYSLAPNSRSMAMVSGHWPWFPVNGYGSRSLAMVPGRGLRFWSVDFHSSGSTFHSRSIEKNLTFCLQPSRTRPYQGYRWVWSQRRSETLLIWILNIQACTEEPWNLTRLIPS